jgi:hypothetical protein
LILDLFNYPGVPGQHSLAAKQSFNCDAEQARAFAPVPMPHKSNEQAEHTVKKFASAHSVSGPSVNVVSLFVTYYREKSLYRSLLLGKSNSHQRSPRDQCQIPYAHAGQCIIRLSIKYPKYLDSSVRDNLPKAASDPMPGRSGSWIMDPNHCGISSTVP